MARICQPSRFGAHQDRASGDVESSGKFTQSDTLRSQEPEPVNGRVTGCHGGEDGQEGMKDKPGLHAGTSRSF